MAGKSLQTPAEYLDSLREEGQLAVTENLNAADYHDRRLLRRAFEEDWPIGRGLRRKAVKKTALALDRTDRVLEIIGLVRNLALLNGQNQRERHHQDDLELAARQQQPVNQIAIDKLVVIVQQELQNPTPPAKVEAARIAGLIEEPK